MTIVESHLILDVYESLDGVLGNNSVFASTYMHNGEAWVRNCVTKVCNSCCFPLTVVFLKVSAYVVDSGMEL